MSFKVAEKTPKGRIAHSPLLYLAILLTLLGLAAIACGVESGNRRAARPTQVAEFHRSPVGAFEQFRIDLAKTEDGCTADPADVSVSSVDRVRLAVQLPQEIRQGATRSLEVVGEKAEVTYQIQGLELTGSGGAFAPGIKEFNLTIESGARRSYDFNTANSGAFDILCDGQKVGTFTVSEG